MLHLVWSNGKRLSGCFCWCGVMVRGYQVASVGVE